MAAKEKKPSSGYAKSRCLPKRVVSFAPNSLMETQNESCSTAEPGWPCSLFKLYFKLDDDDGKQLLTAGTRTTTAMMEIMCCLSEEAKLQRKVNDEIEKQLSRDKTEHSRETKFLLLGPQDVGKTTFMKQMRIINSVGYEEDLCAHICAVFQELVHAMQKIIHAMDTLRIRYRNPTSADWATVVTSTRIEDITAALPCNLAEALRRLWEDDGIQECYSRKIESGLEETTDHFLSNINRITLPGYVPSMEDYLFIKTPSKGINEYNILIDKEFPSRIVDVGEQKSEPKKWIHCFEDVSGVIFMVSLADFESQEKMIEAQRLFKLIVTSNWFTESHILLLLNKKDVFEQKVGRGRSFAQIYPEFKGPANDSRSAREFMRRIFARIEPERPVYYFFTCATDTNDIKYVLPTLREIASVKTGARSRESSDAAFSTSAMAAVAAVINGVSTATAVGAIPDPTLVCSPSAVTNSLIIPALPDETDAEQRKQHFNY